MQKIYIYKGQKNAQEQAAYINKNVCLYWLLHI